MPRWPLVLPALFVVGCVLGGRSSPPAESPSNAQQVVLTAPLDAPAAVVPNDNRRPTGHLRGDTLHVSLTARTAAWRPDLNVDTTVTVQAFAGEDGVPSVPGPFIHAAVGTEIRLTLRNALTDSTLIVHGLRAGTARGDTVHVAPGGTRVIAFRATRAGTFFYWGTRSGRPIRERWGRDAQLTGAIVIDPPGARADSAERVFVITLIDVFPDSSRPPTREDVWEVAINGRSWPHTERLYANVGDTLRWRWINGTGRPHPMHLHGFHFRLTASGTWSADTAIARSDQPEMVTRTAWPGGTFAMEWVPTRAGNWLMHCHMAGHITPYPARADSTRAHDAHDLMRHPLDAMAGLVMGIHVGAPNGRADGTPASEPMASRHLRLVAAQGRSVDSKPARRGFVLQTGADPARDSVEVPGTPLMLRRGERVAITVVNRLPDPTSVHWHGMELEGRFDGVSGWSGLGTSIAPLIAPGDSFTVAFTPPRAGTFIYHTHMDEETQLERGLYGAMLVLEPGERWDPDTDRLLVIGSIPGGESGTPAINGRPVPPPMELTVGRAYRFRVINILPNEPHYVALMGMAGPLPWRMVAKDGAALPPGRVHEVADSLRMGVGEAYDFIWTPAEPGDVAFEAWRLSVRKRHVIRVRR